MTTSNKRTCANCCAFNPSATGDEEPCANLTFFTIHHVDAEGRPLTIHQAPSAADWCDGHQTDAEDKAEDAALAQFWQRLSIAPRMGKGAL